MRMFRMFAAMAIVFAALGSVGCDYFGGGGGGTVQERVFLKVPVEGSDGPVTVWYLAPKGAYGASEVCPLAPSQIEPTEVGKDLYIVCCPRTDNGKTIKELIDALDEEMKAAFKTPPSRLLFAPPGAHLCKS